MKREFLEGLKIEALTKEVIDSIMGENGKDIEAEKVKTAAKETELLTANTTITGLKDTVKKFDGVDVTKLQNDVKDLEIKYDTDIKAGQAETEKVKREYTLKDSLKAIGVTDPDYLIFKHGGAEKFAFDSEGKPAGLEEAMEPYKESTPHMFKIEQKQQVKFKGFVPGEGKDGLPGGEKPTTLADAVKMSLEASSAE